MRIIAVATLCTLVAFSAQAQQVERIKAKGANAAGACAGSLDMLGQYLSRSQSPNPERLLQVQQSRDFFADMPRFPSEDISKAANAFVMFMSDRIRNAPTVDERQAVQRELVKVATGCMASAKAELQTFERAAPSAPGATIPVAPPIAAQPAPIQPYTTESYTAQPLETQPYVAQPLETQPLILDPVVPAQ